MYVPSIFAKFQQGGGGMTVLNKASEQKQLALRFAWDKVDQVFQNTLHTDRGNDPIRWHLLLSCPEEQVTSMFVDEVGDHHALVIAERKELDDLGKWYHRICRSFTFGRLHLRLEVKQEKNLANLIAFSMEH